MVRPVASSQDNPGLARQQGVKAKASGGAGPDPLLPRAREGGVVRSTTDGSHSHHPALVQHRGYASAARNPPAGTAAGAGPALVLLGSGLPR